jgi:8-amino-7-oxononanoate synthase
MSDERDSLFGLDPGQQKLLLEQLQTGKLLGSQEPPRQRRDVPAPPERFGRFSELPEYKQLQVHRVIADRMQILDPFFTCHETKAKGRTRINGEEFLNFATYDYAGLNGHPEVNAAAARAMEDYGTSAGASRLVAGERPPHAHLERALAALYNAEGAIVFVSGHATNVSTLCTLLNARDAAYHDALAHNSLVMGARLSGAARYAFPHNDCGALEEQLRRTRAGHERAMIVTEGLFGMDGSIANLPELIALKRKYGCFLMVDEAHSLGTLGRTGRGVAEHFGADPADVDVRMGTLSKTLCGCGGFIAGCAELAELLRYGAPGFVYSVGMPPPMAAASAKALEIMLREPERVGRLRRLSGFFLREAKERGLNTGHAVEGSAVIPLIAGNSLMAGYLSHLLFERGINALPIVYPVVEEGMARLRFFLSSEHEEADVAAALDAVAENLPVAVRKFQ